MGSGTKSKAQNRGNAFDRARDAVLAIDAGWWTMVAGSGISEMDISDPQFLSLGDEKSVVGGMIFERRTISLRHPDHEDEIVQTITRPVMTRFSALPIDLLERLARDILRQGEAEWREANLARAIAEARSFETEERFELARDLLGADADEADVLALAETMRMPEALLNGGEGAAQFFDDNVSVIALEDDPDGGQRIAPEPPPAPGKTSLMTGEWDYYTPEEVASYDGPESDTAYAFRVVRLCEAIRGRPESAVQLAVQVGAVTREWEMWRENEEFIKAGRARFAEQSRLAKSRAERPWMTQVRRDLAEGRIGANVAQYARDFKSRHRNLSPPGLERIRNFISDLRRHRSTG